MPIPRIVRQWNKAGLNRVTRHIAPWAPGMGLVIHCGLRSGRLYQTPVNVFAAKDGYVFALTYGRDTDWVGECPGRGRLRAAHARALHPADLTAPVSRRVPPRHPPDGTAGAAAYRRRRFPLPPGRTRRRVNDWPILSISAAG